MGNSSTDRWPSRQMLLMQRLRARRTELGLTQKQVVSRLARCGVSTTNRALSSLEHGAGLDVGRLPELATALDCTVTYLVGLTNDPQRWEPDVSQTAKSPPPPDRSVEDGQAASLILGAVFPDGRMRPDAE